MRKRYGSPTPEGVREEAEARKRHFLPHNVLERLGVSSPQYIFVYGITLKGKPLILGPLEEEEAETIASNLLEGEMFYLDTRNKARASGEIKAELALRGMDLDKALQRVGHSLKEGDI